MKRKKQRKSFERYFQNTNKPNNKKQKRMESKLSISKTLPGSENFANSHGVVIKDILNHLANCHPDSYEECMRALINITSCVIVNIIGPMENYGYLTPIFGPNQSHKSRTDLIIEDIAERISQATKNGISQTREHIL